MGLQVQVKPAMRVFERDELVVGRNLGEGSFKSAYRCDWNGTPVVKMLFHLQNQDDKEAEQNFVDELQVVAQLAHPNIVQFLGRCREELAFVIAYCSYGSLFDVLFRPERRSIRDRMTVAHRFKIAIGVARAINFLHRCRPPMIHRDLKGSNILLTENFDALVSDFGLTLTKHKTHGISKHKGEGTCNYMAPEMFQLRGPNITEKSDTWSFGCVLIELFANIIPWIDLQDAEIGRRVTSEDEKRIVPPEIERVQSAPVKALIRKCFRREPQNRPDFEEILDTLQAIADKRR
eukprot:TRINITY_DN11461_c0_g1_i2.p1 TRINITY_DN11461_c0_g1~~TRINITY_DN11461_c0_g1_i2.p1  ORF type:complete len:299 (-),score=37.20 TRINITY_DN11461_c0_g1_i2:19-891(-)